jgi:asparagine synthase (glutamine-hydrolysing)
MCGIAGVFSRSTPDVAADVVGRMVRALAHRGPDSQGTHSAATPSWAVALGHTRLSILDLSEAGRQPMGSDGYVITFNGEIYNFLDLRSELQEAGYRFRSHTDTEVILAAYQHWGPESFARLRGMFAFAIWDERRRRLVLARDQSGIKPLYIYKKDRLFLFASEVRALLATGIIPRHLDRAAVSSFLCFGSVQEPRTIIDGIEALVPNHYMTLDFSGEHILSASYTIPSLPVRIPAELSYKQATSAVRDSLHEAVRLHLVSDVPVGIFLSGGIDSSAVVALVSLITSNPPKTYSVVFEADEGLSESAYSQLVAKKFGTDHTEIVLTESELVSLLPRALQATDQPTMDGINTYVVSQAVRSFGVKVALSGLGSDELFGGYPSFARMQRLLPWGWLIRRGQPLFAAAASLPLPPMLWKAANIAACGTEPHAVYEISRRLFIPAEVGRLMPGAFHSARLCLHPEDKWDAINAISRCELSGYMANTLLRDTDCMSMAHGLEVRVPFLDSVFVRDIMSLPGAWKGGGPTPKRLLIDALGTLLPEEVWRRPKCGFTLPFRRWLRTVLAADVENTLGGCALSAAAGLNFEAVRSTWTSFQHGASGVHWGKPWALYALLQWCRANHTEVAYMPEPRHDALPESRPLAHRRRASILS